MDIRELRLFLHLAESCHFGKTAAAMYISPSTLSRQIQRLEESLGHPLFLRDNRTVQLTAAGEQLKKFAQETVLQYQQLQHALNHQSPSLTRNYVCFVPSLPHTAICRRSSTSSGQNIRRWKSS